MKQNTLKAWSIFYVAAVATMIVIAAKMPKTPDRVTYDAFPIEGPKYNDTLAIKCMKCGKALSFHGSHATLFQYGWTESGISKQSYVYLCEKCWNETSLNQRLDYFAASFVQSGNTNPALFNQVSNAIIDSEQPYMEPGIGWNCSKCGIDMSIKNNWHPTKYHYHEDDPGDPIHRGCFVLCENCWQSLTPAERIPYYRGLFIVWRRSESGEDIHTSEDWISLSNAVMLGK